MAISIHPPRVGRDQVFDLGCTYGWVFQSTLPVWGGTALPLLRGRGRAISIHPPRVGRDAGSQGRTGARRHFNPPSPCGEGRRGITQMHAEFDFNPPSPCGEGRRSCLRSPG